MFIVPSPRTVDPGELDSCPESDSQTNWTGLLVSEEGAAELFCSRTLYILEEQASRNYPQNPGSGPTQYAAQAWAKKAEMPQESESMTWKVWPAEKNTNRIMGLAPNTTVLAP